MVRLSFVSMCILITDGGFCILIYEFDHLFATLHDLIRLSKELELFYISLCW